MSTEHIEGFRLSPQQKRLWHLQKGEKVYVTQGVVLIEGELHADALRRTLANIVSRHEILRTIFLTLPGVDVPVQVIKDESAHNLAEVDLSASPAAEHDALIGRQALAERTADFDFGAGPLARFTLFKLPEGERRLLVTLPALCADTATLGNLMGELARGYEAALKGEQLSDEPNQYADISEWQNEMLESEDTAAGRAFWQQKDLSPVEHLRLPIGETVAVIADVAHSFAPQVLSKAVDSSMAVGVESLARAEQTTPEAVLLSCWATLVRRLTGTSNPIIGVATPHRKYDELKDACGPLSKFLPAECRLDEADTLADLAPLMEQQLRELAKWEEYFNWGQPAGGPRKETLLFPLSFSYERPPSGHTAGGAAFSLVANYECSDHYQIKLVCRHGEQALTLEWHYDSSLFQPADIRRLSEMFRQLLGGALERPHAAFSLFDIVGEEERHLLIDQFNRTEADLSADICLHELFERQVAQGPDEVALIFRGARVTYGELNGRADRLAARLHAEGVGAETLIGVCLERSAEMVVALLGVLKAGGAYVPLDPALPKARMAHILRDIGANLLLTDRSTADTLNGLDVKIMRVEDEAGESAAVSETPNHVCGPSNVAYVIYTSGSTGTPKGVMIPHRAVCNRILWGQSVYPLTHADRVLQSASFGFDFSVWEIFAPLAFGASVVLPVPGGQQDTTYLVKLINEEQVTTAHFVPTMLNLFLDEKGLDKCDSLKRVFAGGEALSAAQQEKFQARLRADLYNQYGPTETTIDSTYHLCRPGPAGAPSVPIGKPIANTGAYIFDEELRPAPLGVAGHLHLSGVGLARGYLGRPELTAERFIPHPFSREPGARLYRTGDLARFLPDGNIEFLGRLDHQVKIRGMRIELGEIDALLSAHAGVVDCVTVVREDKPGDPRLIAYVVARPGQKAPTRGELHQFLSESVPEYMIPSAFVPLAALPLTHSGKLDRTALPPPENTGLDAERAFVAPRTPIEASMAEKWSQVLGLERVGIHDNFFALGGHSLMAMQLVSKLREAFRIELPLRALFDAPTIEQLAGIVEEMLVAKLNELTEEEAQQLLALGGF